MNNFEGQLHLYPEVCIDNFESNCIFNLMIRCYILTHFHDDHMKNLEDDKFRRLLKDGQNSIKFLCSPITKKFIQTCGKYQHLAEYCYEVECETPVLVNINRKECLTVTFCGSGHCPGSVMVFLEGSRGNVLFTGDFRLPLNSAKRLIFFKEKTTSLNEINIKKVKDLYIDMTFFKPEIKYIPTRESSVLELNKFLETYLSENNYNQNGYFKNVVYLKTSARIGYEYVLHEINRTTGYKIHVNELIYEIYKELPEIQSFLTLDPRETPIHSCIYENRKRDQSKTDLMSCPYSEPKAYLKKSDSKLEPIYPCEFINTSHSVAKMRVNAVKIILSAMWFTDTAGVDKIFVEYKPPVKDLNTDAYRFYNKVYRLCFSFHSSFEEIIDFVNNIKPDRLHSIALPESTTDKIINDHFYTNGRFTNFQLNNKALLANSNDSNNILKYNQLDDSKTCLDNIKSLVLRKRKSNQDSFDVKKRDSSSDQSSASDNDCSLNFGSDGDNDSIEIKKIKSF